MAGINIGGGYATFPGVIGTAITKVCDLEVARTGLRERGGRGRPGYRFVTDADRVDHPGRLLPRRPADHGQADRRAAHRPAARARRSSAGTSAAKRIDVLATAIWNGMTVDEVLRLDLSYAPPFAPVWDPVLIAARKALDAVELDVRADYAPQP